MGIFMITINQISSHTMSRVYPRNQPATWASSFPQISALPCLSNCVTSKLARAWAAWIPRVDEIRTGSPARTS